MPGSRVLSLLLERRVIVVAGAGGVGKTTIAAGLALAAAARGRKVLCLTVDPAKRLADRLGLDVSTGDEQRVDAGHFGELGLPLSGELSLMMLDTKRTFDDLVRRHASSPEACQRILNNEFYEYVSTQLAGTQAYMAMEKVRSVLEDAHYDLVVLDTPPTSDALDFLDAPERLKETLDSAALGWLSQAFERSGRVGIHLFARGVALLLRSIARLTGQGFLERLAEFVTEVNELFGGFRERADRVARAFRDPSFAYALVATPIPDALSEASFFAERLQALGMRADALVINRTRPGVSSEPSKAALLDALRARSLESSQAFAEKILVAARAERMGADLEHATLVNALGTTSSLALDRIPLRIQIPVFPESVHDVLALIDVSRRFLDSEA